MALVNVSLLLGGLGIAIPIVLHLTMRQQPKRMVFPSAKFLRARRESNQRQLQLKQWILLALRCLAVMIAAAALARPSVAAAALGSWLVVALAGGGAALTGAIALVAHLQRRGRGLVGGLSGGAGALAILAAVLALQIFRHGSPRMLGDHEAPVAAALVIDSSPRMEYRFGNKSRLEAARQLASELLEELPPDSDIAVVDARPGAPVFAMDRSAAEQAIARVETSGLVQSLAATLDTALAWLATSQRTRQEIYVLTDLARGAWPDDDMKRLRERLDKQQNVQLYLVDVGVDEPRNVALGELRLSTETLSKSAELVIETEATSWGASGSRAVELSVEQFDTSRPIVQDGQVLLPPAESRGRVEIELKPGESRAVSFRLRGWTPGTHHGQLKLIGEDGLAVDDVRHFTVLVDDARPVLVLAPPGTATQYLVEAIAPAGFRQTGQARFECREAAQATIVEQKLGEFAAVALVDPLPLTPDEWAALAKYVDEGGSLAVLLGHNAQAAGSFHEPLAVKLLGGKLARQWRSPAGDLFLSPSSYEHPVLRDFREVATSVPWDEFPVYRHWEFDPLEPTARMVLNFGNRRPALVETTLGRGRVLTMTTPVSDPARPRGRQPWNELPTGPDAWPFVMLADQMFNYLAGASEARSNYLAGQTAVVVGREAVDPERYQLFLPNGQTQDVAARQGRVTIKSTSDPGSYRLKGFRGGPVLRGFSVNLPPSATDLTRVTTAELDAKLGADRYQLARSHDEIDREVGEARVGREFYPLLMLALAGVLALEQLLSNRFYGAKA